MKAKRMIRHMAVILCVVMAAVFAVPKVTAAEGDGAYSRDRAEVLYSFGAQVLKDQG